MRGTGGEEQRPLTFDNWIIVYISAQIAFVLPAGIFRQNQSANAIFLTFSFLMYIRCYGEEQKRHSGTGQKDKPHFQ